MSLRAFHLLFIGLSVALLLFFAAWATGRYQVERAIGYLVTAVVSLAASGALAAYGAAFRRKTRGM
ncbi:MAG: hypothetical protein A3H95_04885 [Acidobacteria bacterium RIFCSPLOWO2_02_FULL_64_15]|nr:MAG: hypothetical protein A3H95_04885 [Acidobacteria bacterium RIFCSPLOWO2_02_FULL_64_15]